MEREITTLAESHGYYLEFHKPENKLLRFRADHEFAVDVWYTSMTVGIMHINQQIRYEREVSLQRLEQILIERI
jgi:hypothetical protein